MNHTIFLLAIAGALFAVPGCADDIAPSQPPDAGLPLTVEPDATPAGKVVTTREPDGTRVTRVDSSVQTAWVYIDLETGVEVDASAGWDLATQRYHIQLNGGVSGTAGVEVAPVRDATLSSVTAAPDGGWVTDVADGNGDGQPERAFETGDGWYAYDQTTHVLEPRPIVWVLRTSDGAVHKLVIESYYDDAGTSGHIRLRWAPLTPGAS